MISVRKRTWLLVGLALWWCLTPVRVWGVSTSASAAVLMDADTGQVLFDHNGGRRMLIASTTKIMTALVALERASPTDVITVKQEHMTEGSSMYLKPGERVTVEELLYCDLVSSANEACNILAETVGGSVSGFVDMMNAKAKELGIHGKETTPYLLDEIQKITGGDSLEANIRLVYNNARLASAIAAELSR